jgi:uncharacterized protein YegL
MSQIQTGHFGFSAAKVEDLGATEYTLVTIVADRSGSTAGFQTDMEACVKEIIKASQHSPRADNLMVRYVTFDSSHQEEHGYKLLSDCVLDEYDGTLSPTGLTALYDATIDAVEAATNYGETLIAQDFDVNAITVVITDGWENSSKFNDVGYVKKAFAETLKQEKLESLISILVGVNAGEAGTALQQYANDAGFSQYVELKDASKNTLAKLAQFVSSSISSQSQALGSGAASTPINPSVHF